MDAAMAGIVTIAFCLLLSRRLGWNADPARIPVLIATVLFAFAIFFPTIGALEQETGWIIAGHVSTALGGIVLVIALLQFERKGQTKSDKPDAARGKRKRKMKKQATAPPGAPADPAPTPPDPDDPYTGPHGEGS